MVNERGVERAIATDAVRTVGFPYSLSPTFLKNNQNQTLEENLDILEKVKQKADEAGLDTMAYISMAFGNPYGDLWNADELIEGVGSAGRHGPAGHLAGRHRRTGDAAADCRPGGSGAGEVRRRRNRRASAQPSR